MPRSWLVSDAARLDAQLAGTLAISRQHARRLLAAGVVRVNDHPTTERDKGKLLQPGDRVEVDAVNFTPLPRPDLPLTVLQQGDDFVVVDKPAGMPVHPLGPQETDTVLNAVVARYPQLASSGASGGAFGGGGGGGVGEGGLRSGVVHRLDVETSGCLAFALTQERWQNLRDAFRGHRVTKTYHALVAGRLEGERTETLDLYVAQHKPARVKVVPQGRPASAGRAPIPHTRPCTLTRRTLRATDRASLLEIDLATGHLHQVRVTLAHLGHPILGDALYGDADTAAAAPRLMLHATRLRYGELEAATPHPFNL